MSVVSFLSIVSDVSIASVMSKVKFLRFGLSVVIALSAMIVVRF